MLEVMKRFTFIKFLYEVNAFFLVDDKHFLFDEIAMTLTKFQVHIFLVFNCLFLLFLVTCISVSQLKINFLMTLFSKILLSA